MAGPAMSGLTVQVGLGTSPNGDDRIEVTMTAPDGVQPTAAELELEELLGGVFAGIQPVLPSGGPGEPEHGQVSGSPTADMDMLVRAWELVRRKG